MPSPVAHVINADLMPTHLRVKWRQAAAACLLAAPVLCLGLSPAAAGNCGEAFRAASGDSAIDGDTFRTTDGQQWRLAGVLAPKRSDGARIAPERDATARTPPRSRSSPADAARTALDVLVRRQAFWLMPLDETADRYGRRLVIVRDATCASVAERLLAAGHARVYPTNLTEPWIADLYAAEAVARTAGHGLWGDARYRVLTAAEAGGALGSYIVVEDRPVGVRTLRGGTILVFGPDRRRDFQVFIGSRVRRLMTAARLDPAALVGTRIRVRGWAGRRFGAPAIELAVPGQIEVIGP
jgi:endonuclease YncB( thermonuclease family)